MHDNNYVSKGSVSLCLYATVTLCLKNNFIILYHNGFSDVIEHFLSVI